MALTGCFITSLAYGAPKAPDKEPPKNLAPKIALPETALVGEVTLKLVGPNGLERVDGIDPTADKFLDSLKERFKLRVLAVYSDPTEFKRFSADLANQRPSPIPRMALISVPTRMDKKSYDEKAVKKEISRYREWFSFAVNTRPIAWLMGRKANSRLKSKLGLDTHFSYLTGPETKRFDLRDLSVSFSVLPSMELYGAKSDFFVAASMLSVPDKLVFLSWIEPSQAVSALNETRAKVIVWLFNMAKANGVTLAAPASED
jgi:hypothetical protein